MKRIVLIVAALVSTTSFAAQLRDGTFICEDSAYNEVKLLVSRHPTKQHKAVINWAGRDRILHREQTNSGAVRYEGAVSGLLYVQTPHHSVLLDDNNKKVILSECKYVN